MGGILQSLHSNAFSWKKVGVYLSKSQIDKFWRVYDEKYHASLFAKSFTMYWIDVFAHVYQIV